MQLITKEPMLPWNNKCYEKSNMQYNRNNKNKTKKK